MGPPRFSVPLRIYERGNVDSGYKANSYIGYFYRYSTGRRRILSMARWIRRLGRAWAESLLLNADERHDEICSAHDYVNSRVLLTRSWLDTRLISMLKRIQTATCFQSSKSEMPLIVAINPLIVLKIIHRLLLFWCNWINGINSASLGQLVTVVR
jgi:hypothetical protein